MTALILQQLRAATPSREDIPAYPLSLALFIALYARPNYRKASSEGLAPTMDGSLYYLLSLSLCFTVGVSGTNFSDCATKLSTLELALYETGDNLFEITQAFFPPSTRTSRYIRVTYKFLEDDNINEDQDCNVTYIWAVGGFLFFQPPTLFEYNSLFFNYPNNNLTDVPVVLPAECRPIVEADGQCSCSQRNTQMLDVLTQQVSSQTTCRSRSTE